MGENKFKLFRGKNKELVAESIVSISADEFRIGDISIKFEDIYVFDVPYCHKGYGIYILLRDKTHYFIQSTTWRGADFNHIHIEKLFPKLVYAYMLCMNRK